MLSAEAVDAFTSTILTQVERPMYISVKDIFKNGIGPSSSHTMGPMTSAARYLKELAARKNFSQVVRICVHLHGSLAFTGKGHGTDKAVLLGLLGFEPSTLDIDAAGAAEVAAREIDQIRVAGNQGVLFKPSRDLVFEYGLSLPGHPNGLRFVALNVEGTAVIDAVYYSVGGGFVLSADELASPPLVDEEQFAAAPFPFASAAEMLAMSATSGLSISDMKRANETACGHLGLDGYLDRVWNVMDACMERGLKVSGLLPGGLSVRRRAAAIFDQLQQETLKNNRTGHSANEWLMVYALAVNEENAAGRKVVTAPTNGAAGVVPAVLKYYVTHTDKPTRQGIRNFLLTASAIGGLIKHNASISGAEVGCQGEVGSASAMAAAGFCAVLGGTSTQIENAAEIALEHHLGLTCDPVGGLVQVPCIERNGIGAVKALSAALLGLRGNGSHLVSLDVCVEIMRQTGRDMSSKFKETAIGGLAVNLPEC